MVVARAEVRGVRSHYHPTLSTHCKSPQAREATPTPATAAHSAHAFLTRCLASRPALWATVAFDVLRHAVWMAQIRHR